MTRMKIYRLVVTGFVAGLLSLAGLGASMMSASAQSGERPPLTVATLTVSPVTSYNDGFTDAKKDDCEQGFQPACAWLHHKSRPLLPAWFHAIRAPRGVARDACGRDVGAVEIWSAASTDGGAVLCQSGRVALP
jgi:hypothetical protein